MYTNIISCTEKYISLEKPGASNVKYIGKARINATIIAPIQHTFRALRFKKRSVSLPG